MAGGRRSEGIQIRRARRRGTYLVNGGTTDGDGDFLQQDVAQDDVFEDLGVVVGSQGGEIELDPSGRSKITVPRNDEDGLAAEIASAAGQELSNRKG